MNKDYELWADHKINLKEAYEAFSELEKQLEEAFRRGVAYGLSLKKPSEENLVDFTSIYNEAWGKGEEDV